jgi:hypothetical protein
MNLFFLNPYYLEKNFVRMKERTNPLVISNPYFNDHWDLPMQIIGNREISPNGSKYLGINVL